MQNFIIYFWFCKLFFKLLSSSYIAPFTLPTFHKAQVFHKAFIKNFTKLFFLPLVLTVTVQWSAKHSKEMKLIQKEKLRSFLAVDKDSKRRKQNMQLFIFLSFFFKGEGNVLVLSPV